MLATEEGRLGFADRIRPRGVALGTTKAGPYVGPLLKSCRTVYRPGPEGVLLPGFEPGFEVPGLEPGFGVPGFDPGLEVPGLVDPRLGAEPGFEDPGAVGVPFGFVPGVVLFGLVVGG